MNPSLSQQRCLNHAEREAVARCPECSHFFCRECVTEHEDRVICASCLKKTAKEKKILHLPLAAIGALAMGLTGLFTTWLFFYMIGLILAGMPGNFHDGSIWEPAFRVEE